MNWFPTTEEFQSGLKRARAKRPWANISAALTHSTLTFYDAGNHTPLAKVVRTAVILKKNKQA